MYLPIITPTAILINEFWHIVTEKAITDRIVADSNEGVNPTELCDTAVRDIATGLSRGTVIVKLDEDQVRDLLEGNRQASWICDLQSTLQDMVDAGQISVLRTFDCEGVITVEVEVSEQNLEAKDADDAMNIFMENVQGDWESYQEGESFDGWRQHPEITGAD
jgi:hypothetical protein